MPFYRNIFLNSLKISWRNKYLWFFGIFASFLSTSGGYETILSAINGDRMNYFPGINGFSEAGLFHSGTISNIQIIISNGSAGDIAQVLFVVLLITGLSLFLAWVSVVSQVAIVSESVSMRKAKITEVEGEDNIKRSLVVGKKYFWKVFGLNVLARIVLGTFFTVISILVISQIGTHDSFLFELFFVIMYVLFIALTLSISFIAKYSIAFVIVKNKNIVDSVKLALNLFVKNWIISLELAFMLFSLNFVVGLIVMFATMVAIIPFYFFSMLVYQVMGFLGFSLIAIPSLIIILLGVTVAGAILTCFQISSWAGLFLELTSRSEKKSKIMRVAESIKK
ncbi:hypothetical protein ISS03_03185 [Patescibacteria group bacterium]|nr:hypothetical protein [Patescibacteria group bacterium]